MVYVMSDLHGQYEKYRKMLSLIGFSEEDELYILGDVVDRGEGVVPLLRDMSLCSNVFPLMGNHEYMATYFLKKLSLDVTEESCEREFSEDVITGLAEWLLDGGRSTLEGFRNLSREEREELLDYLSEFLLYEELSVGGREFVLVHGTLPDFEEDKPLVAYDPLGMLTQSPDYTVRYFKDKYLVTGHTPTALIDKSYTGRIIRKNGHIAMDCGAGWGSALGCLRLDDLREYYVE